MTARFPRILLATLCCLLAAAAAASAECAWWLWFAGAGSEWNIGGVFETRRECKQYLSTFQETRPPNIPFTKLLCLPDTVDPRGPKGK